MKKAIFLYFLFLATLQVTLFRLNTNEITKLNVGDSLISTLGYFKATLLGAGCQLSIQTFSSNGIYVSVGNYSSPNITGNCKYLTIIQGQLVTQSNSTYFYVGDSYNLSTIFTLDDWGVFRLIGTYRMPNYLDQVSQQATITNFTKNQTFVFPASQLTVRFINNFGSLNNLRNWQFNARWGQLDISQQYNSGIIVSYGYAQFKINNSIITDFIDRTFPAAIFPNITYSPRCLEPRLYLDYKPPFVFVADPYWPVFTLYQQGRYKILQVSFSQADQSVAWQNKRQFGTRNQPSVCPPFTFQFNGNCTTVCPYPYYYEMRSQYGYCVLTCEQFTPKNDTTRICSCFNPYENPSLSSATITNCSSDATPYPYGCYCNQTGKYFDRDFTLSCVTNCPSQTFANNGLCMNCPPDCLTCDLDQIFKSYLECKFCMTGFTLTNGQCYITCSPGLGFSVVSGVCKQCADPNCINCTQNVNICFACSVLYSLSGSACVQSCPNSTTLVTFDNLRATCLNNDHSCLQVLPTHFKGEPSLKCIACNGYQYMHLNTCVDTCPTGYITNSNYYCYCANTSTITINSHCLPLVFCPIEMGWDPLSSSCLSCNFGCLTCYNSVCTSCSPGYFLYISPQGIRCRRKSPLYPCDQQYGWIQSTCLFLNFANPVFRLSRCLPTVQNCKACAPDSKDTCILCISGYINHNNTCIQTCPNGMIPYDNICILLEIANCSQPYLKTQSQEFILNYTRISAQSSPYQFYTFIKRESSNDPVGYIPFFQQMISKKNDGLFRNSRFYHPVWTCLSCNSGMGLNQNMTQCLPCPDPCQTCYMALNTSCLTVKKNKTCQYYIDWTTNLCVQNCRSSKSVPTLINGVWYCSIFQIFRTQNEDTHRISSNLLTEPIQSN